MFWSKKQPEERKIDFERARAGIVRVGESARGFMCCQNIVTLATCLPQIPEFKPFDPEYCAVYPKLIGRLKEEPWNTAYCRFADAVSNVTVLEEDWLTPEQQYELDNHRASGWDFRYRISEPAKRSPVSSYSRQDVWIYTLDCQWKKCVACTYMRGISLEEVSFDLDPRLSGTPIVDETGAAIGIVSISKSAEEREEWGDTHPVTTNLPAWLWTWSAVEG